MQLNCRSCGKPIVADNVNINMGIAKCDVCHSVFSFADSFAAPQRAAALAERPKVPTPKGFTIENWGSDLTISRRWFTPAVFFLVLFCVFWDGFLVFWYGIAFTQDDVPWIMILFPTLHLAVGVGLTYFVLCCFVNITVIKASSGQLSVRHGPLPWPGNHLLNSADIEQLYCQGRYHRGRHGGRYSYELQAVLHDGMKQKLLSGLHDPDQAIFVEQQLENHLRIADHRVPGELDHGSPVTPATIRSIAQVPPQVEVGHGGVTERTAANSLPQKSGINTRILVVLAIVMILPVVLCVGLCGGGIFMGVKAAGNHPVYKAACERVRSDDRVHTKLGDNITAAFPSEFNLQQDFTEFTFTVSGTRGSASVYAKGDANNVLSFLEVTFSDGTEETLVPSTPDD